MKAEEETTSELGVYRPFVECGNCDLAQRIPINHGVLISNHECPNCKNKTLHVVRVVREKTSDKD